MSNLDIMKTIRNSDPDGNSFRQPTDRDHENFKHWVVNTFGMDVWYDYLSNWDVYESSDYSDDDYF